MKNALMLGWREWCSLPDLGIPAIKTKVDTGAKTSALHTFQIDPFDHNGQSSVRFLVHPLQHNNNLILECTAAIKDLREVSDSGGHIERRYIIETMVKIGEHSWPIEMSLTNRDSMRFRMLLGRRAMEEQVLVNPSASYVQGRMRARSLYSRANKKVTK